MGIFTKKQINSEEYEKLSKQITDIFTILSKITAEVEAIKTNQNSLRGMVNRKFNPQGLEEQKQEEENIKGMKFY